MSQCILAARIGGAAALFSHRAHGRCPRLRPEQKRLMPDFLWHGAEAYGFRGDLWSCTQVAQVLQWEFGITVGTPQEVKDKLSMRMLMMNIRKMHMGVPDRRVLMFMRMRFSAIPRKIMRMLMVFVMGMTMRMA